MFDKKQKLVAVMAPIAMAVSFSLASVSANAGNYVTESAASVVTNGYGECWNATSGMAMSIPACGDAAMAGPSDADGDGVVDADDQCPTTPKGVSVTAFGCAVDSDKDGVADYKDACPNTPAGVAVDSVGCGNKVDITINTTNDHFDFDSAVLKPAMKSALDGVAASVAGNPALNVIGHTDSTGPAAYNQGLSERRAHAAGAYLKGKGLTNLTVSGKGESSPAADNGTRAGRAANRRVEIQSK